jgi:uncharacterized protein YndB with AHSA1/START domain
MSTTENPATLDVTLPSELEIVMTRVFDAPRRLLWEAHTNPEHVRQWLLGPPGYTMPVCEIDLRPGGDWRYVWRAEDGTEMKTGGKTLEVAAPERLVQTECWEMGSDCSHNVLLLSEADGRTTLQQRMRFPSQEIRDMVLQTGMADGVGMSYDRLAELLPALG